jgi:anti-anti-sigma regulatory factor
MAWFLHPAEATNFWEGIMQSIHIDKVGDMAVVECEGRFVHSDAAFSLRGAVTSQVDARIVVLDLTEMSAIGGGSVGMLVFLQRWAQDHDIRFKLFNPSKSVRDRLEHTGSMSELEIASLDEMMALLGRADSRYALAS